jgi:hypothetical protein
MSEKLKPCPFCGGNNVEYTICNVPFNDVIKNHFAGCIDCNIGFTVVSTNPKYGTIQESLTKEWNNRILENGV